MTKTETLSPGTVRHGKGAAFIVCYILCLEYVNYFVHTLVNLLGIQILYLTQIVIAAGLGMLMILLIRNRERSPSSLILPAVVLLLYWLTVVRLGNNAEYFTDAVPEKLFLYCIPAYVAVYMIEDFKVFYEMLRKFCFFLLFTEALTVLLMTTESSAFVWTDYQGISYGLLIPLVFWICRDRRTKLETVCLVVAFLIMIFFGGRGPLACALLCVFYKMVMNAARKPWWFALLLLASGALLYFYQDIIQWVVTVSEEYGFSGSIAKYYQMGDVFMTSDRKYITDYAKAIIADHPMLGVGMGGTRYWLGVYGYKFYVYPHSILYEFWCDYGVVLGTALLGLLGASAVRTFLRRNRNPEAYALFEICFFSTGFLILLFSSSYLFCPLFFAMLALFVQFSERNLNGKNRNSDLSP